jgi:hypothetical protein
MASTSVTDIDSLLGLYLRRLDGELVALVDLAVFVHPDLEHPAAVVIAQALQDGDVVDRLVVEQPRHALAAVAVNLDLVIVRAALVDAELGAGVGELVGLGAGILLGIVGRGSTV